MGLDMYLYSYKKKTELPIKAMLILEDLIWDGKQKGIIEEYKDFLNETRWGYSFLTKQSYWRKANSIHKWFVDNVQNGRDDCGYYLVTKKNIKALYDLCKQVLKECGENEFCFDSVRASKLLPVQDGFFFGSTDYNEWYIEDIKNSLEQLNKILKNFNFKEEYLLYHSSW